MKADAEAWTKAVYGTFDRWLHLTNYWLIDTIAAAVLGTKLRPGPPLWMAIIGPPGSAKTEVIKSLESLKHTHSIGDITTKTFASGLMARKKGAEPPGILQNLPGTLRDGVIHAASDNFFLFNDFATVFTLPGEQKGQILGQMRSIYDGHFDANWGSGMPPFHWRGRIGAFVAATPSWDQEMRHFGAMGERFLLWRESRPGFQATLSAMQQNEDMQMELRSAMKVLDRISLETPEIDDDSMNWVARLANTVSMARTPIPRDHRNEPTDIARYESPTRLGQQLFQLMKGMVLWKGMPANSQPVRFAVQRAAISSLPLLRFDVLSRMSTEGVVPQTLCTSLSASRSVVKRCLEDLLMLRVLVKDMSSGDERMVPMPGWEEFIQQVQDVNRALGGGDDD